MAAWWDVCDGVSWTGGQSDRGRMQSLNVSLLQGREERKCKDQGDKKEFVVNKANSVRGSGQMSAALRAACVYDCKAPFALYKQHIIQHRVI